MLNINNMVSVIVDKGILLVYINEKPLLFCKDFSKF